MVELTVNSVLLFVELACCMAAAVYTIRGSYRTFGLLTMFYGVSAMGSLYWVLFQFFYDHTPNVFYVSDISWYASYLFLWHLIHHLSTEEERGFRHPLMYAVPVIPAGFCVFYFRWGDYVGNVISALLMGLLMYHSVRGLLYIRKEGKGKNRRMLYTVVLAFCVLEYCVWTSSCFWGGDTLANSYFWFDIMVYLCMTLFLPGTRKAVKPE